MFRTLTPAGRALFVVLVAAGAVTWLGCALATAQRYEPAQWLAMLGLGALAVLAGRLSLEFPGLGSVLSLTDSIAFAAVLWFGPAPAAAIAGLDAAITTRRHTRRWWSVASSAAVMTISILCAGIAYHATLSLFHDGGTASRLVPMLVPLAEMTVVHYLINSGLVALLSGVVRRRSPARIWRESYAATLQNFAMAAAVAGLAYAMIDTLGWSALALVAPIGVLAHVTYRHYLGREASKDREIERMNAVHLATLEALAAAIDARGQSKPGHLERVQAYAVGLARLAGVDDATREAVRMAAILHDVGKLAVPDYLLNKPGQLTDAERRKVQSYPRLGAEILEHVDFPYPVRDVIRHQRERWDGRGYPEGLAGEEIPIGARIFSIADVADEMRHPRPYRPAMTREAILDHLRRGAGSAYDPRLVELFVANFDRLEALAAGADPGESDALDEISASQRDWAARLYRERESRRALADISAVQYEEHTLLALTSELNACLGLAETARVAVERVRSLVPCRAAVAYASDGSALVAMHREGPAAAGYAERVSLPASGDLATCLEIGSSLVNVPPPEELLDRSGGVDLSARAVALVPLMADRARPGLIVLARGPGEAFSPEHERLLDRVRAPIASALEAARVHDENREHAMCDPVTGLPNARFLFTQIEKELARARREQGRLALVVLDLDRFKPVNDRYGHDVGDEVLRLVGETLRSTFRAGDTVCRWGGDEFVALLPGATEPIVAGTVQRVQAAVDDVALVTSSGIEVAVGISAGWAVYPDDGDRFEELVRVADRKMYRDKERRHAGDGRVVATPS